MLWMLWFFELRRNSCQNIIERYDAIISDVTCLLLECLHVNQNRRRIFLPQSKQPLGFEPTRRLM